MKRRWLMPSVLGDGRLDTVIELLHQMMSPQRRPLSLVLDWRRTTAVLPAGHALLAVLADTHSEFGVRISNVSLDTSLSALKGFRFLDSTEEASVLPPAERYQVMERDFLLTVHDSSIDLEMATRVQDLFSDRLSAEMLFACRLILNELIVNHVDHSSTERYYLYAGISNGETHIGSLDMGITIPAKLATKYRAEDDVEYLKLALQRGIGTRRIRQGGLGLTHLYELTRRWGGRFTMISRNAQIRKYFATRRGQANLLKCPLRGTWCMIRLPLQGES